MAASAGAPLQGASRSGGAAVRRRQQRERQLSRHVEWMWSLCQCRAHHTFGKKEQRDAHHDELSRQNEIIAGLLYRVQKLEEKLAAAQGVTVQVGTLAKEDPQAEADTISGPAPGGEVACEAPVPEAAAEVLNMEVDSNGVASPPANLDDFLWNLHVALAAQPAPVPIAQLMDVYSKHLGHKCDIERFLDVGKDGLAATLSRYSHIVSAAGSPTTIKATQAADMSRQQFSALETTWSLVDAEADIWACTRWRRSSRMPWSTATAAQHWRAGQKG